MVNTIFLLHSFLLPLAASAQSAAVMESNFVRVNDWYNPAYGGGFNATYQCEVVAETSSDDVVVEFNYTGAGTPTSAWTQSYNGGVDVGFIGANGGFAISNVNKSYKPRMNVGDRFQVAIQVQGAGFSQADFNVSCGDGVTVSTPVVDPNGLPPDPGAAGTVTIAGIDTDSDGVRDDIQRWISVSYPNQDGIQAALTRGAIVYQSILLQANDPLASLEHMNSLNRIRECLHSLDSEYRAASTMMTLLKAQYLNTFERSVEYLKFSDSLSGEITLFRPMSEWESSCNIEVNTDGVGQ